MINPDVSFYYTLDAINYTQRSTDIYSTYYI